MATDSNHIIEKYDAGISLLDPLGFDEFHVELRAVNQKMDLLRLEELSDLFIRRACDLADHNDAAADKAVMRDLGILMGSLIRWGKSPVALFPELESVLMNIAGSTQMVPRDTVYHYGLWNPQGDRERRFTTFEDEHYLINSVRISAPHLIAACTLLDRIDKDCHAGAVDIDLLEKVVAHLQGAFSGLTEATRFIRPDVFSKELRQYFDPLQLSNRTYVAAGGGQIPLFLVDLLLWGSGCSEGSYRHFVEESAEYLPTVLGEIFDRHYGQPSMLTHIENRSYPLSEADYRNLSDGMREMAGEVMKFRFVHKKYSAKAFTPKNIGDYDTGSGGYHMNFVEKVYELTNKYHTRISAL